MIEEQIYDKNFDNLGGKSNNEKKNTSEEMFSMMNAEKITPTYYIYLSKREQEEMKNHHIKRIGTKKIL